MNLFASFPIHFDFEGKTYSGTAVLFRFEQPNGLPYLFRIVFNNVYFGDITFSEGGWSCSNEERGHSLIQETGDYIQMYYELQSHYQNKYQSLNKHL